MNSRVSIDVKVKVIQSLVDDLNSGRYYLPSFQRQYVWDEDDIKDLIDSIIRNYPIGTIILWKPSTASIPKIDPFSRPFLNFGEYNHKEIFYVIDGQQRLTSLLLLLNNWEIQRGDERIACEPISYNPSNKKFYKSSKKGIDLSKLVKAFYRYDDKAIAELKRTTSEENYMEMERMIKGILNNPVPICIMETEHEDVKTFGDMAEAFIRVNKYGIRIGNLELMLSFLAGAVSGNLKKKIGDMYEDLYGRFKIELQPVIRFVFSNFELKQTQISKVEQFKSNIRIISEYSQDETAKIFKKSGVAMRLTVDLLEKELGICDSRLLPSQTPLIPIAKYFYKRGIDSIDMIEEKEIKDIINWFVLVSFNGYYSSQTDTKLDNDMGTIKKTSFPKERLFANMQSKKARTIISKEDIKRGLNLNVLRLQGRAYLFMLYIILIKNQADDWGGVILSIKKIDDIARHHIFPKEFLEKTLELEEPASKEVSINNLSNITFIDNDINKEIGDKSPEKYMNEYVGSAKKHFISTDKELWSIDQYTTFLQYRIKQVHAAGKKFFGEIFE